MNKKQLEEIKNLTLAYFCKAGIIITKEEEQNLEIVDFGLQIPEKIGLQLLVYVNTKRVCAKELVLFPNQICPEHRHPNTADKLGKEETFRCRYGKVFLYVEGNSTENLSGNLPEEEKANFTVFHEVILKPGEQYTLQPNTLHWFQAGEEGAVISEFSTQSTDESDVFTDPRIIR